MSHEDGRVHVLVKGCSGGWHVLLPREQPADRGTPRSQPPHHKELDINGGMAANLFVRELPATIRDLLPSTAAIEQQRQRRTRQQRSRQISSFVFAVRAERRKAFCFLPSPVSGTDRASRTPGAPHYQQQANRGPLKDSRQKASRQRPIDAACRAAFTRRHVPTNPPRAWHTPEDAPPHACHHANRNRLRDVCAHIPPEAPRRVQGARSTEDRRIPAAEAHPPTPADPHSPTRPSPPHPVRRLRHPVPPSRNLSPSLSASPFSPVGLPFPHLAASSPPQPHRSPI
eukprot:scaffold823_cov128-Isochrysis_galbana.AAC.2